MHRGDKITQTVVTCRRVLLINRRRDAILTATTLGHDINTAPGRMIGSDCYNNTLVEHELSAEILLRLQTTSKGRIGYSRLPPHYQWSLNTFQSRPYWQRNRPFNDPAREGIVPTKATYPPPAIAVSAASKSKLTAFRFDPPRVTQEHSDQDPAMATVVPAVGQENQVADYNVHKEAEVKILSPRKHADHTINPSLPQTPAARIPLGELTTGTNEAYPVPNVEDTSPEDRVCWKHRRSPTSSGTPYTPALIPRKGTKRARSSSPAQSPYDGPVEDRNRKEILSMQSLQKMLKTPQADPALELWNKYSANGVSKPVFQSSQLPPFTQLVVASPRVGGLRRTVSCGMEWPVSTTKRRKISGSNSRDISEHQSPAAGRSVKLSKVNSLVEKIQESLAKPEMVEDIGDISSSSSLPERVADGPSRCSSPTRGGRELAAETAAESKIAESLPVPQPEARQNSDRSSDYGDFDAADLDFDVDVFARKDDRPAALLDQEGSKQSHQNPSGYEDTDPDIDALPNTDDKKPAPMLHQEAPMESHDGSSEYGDLDLADIDLSILDNVGSGVDGGEHGFLATELPPDQAQSLFVPGPIEAGVSSAEKMRAMGLWAVSDGTVEDAIANGYRDVRCEEVNIGGKHTTDTKNFDDEEDEFGDLCDEDFEEVVATDPAMMACNRINHTNAASAPLPLFTIAQASTGSQRILQQQPQSYPRGPLRPIGQQHGRQFQAGGGPVPIGALGTIGQAKGNRVGGGGGAGLYQPVR